jgi:molybdenum cofactor biosynthesis enzyme MoaA
LVFAKKEMIETIEKNVGQIVPLDNASSQDKGNDMHGAGHAKPYTFANGRGTIGYIPSIEPFSNSCGRIRLKFDGKLLPWLFEKQGYDLRSLLREGQPEHEIKRQLREDGKKKPQRIIMIIQESNLRPSLSLMHR